MFALAQLLKYYIKAASWYIGTTVMWCEGRLKFETTYVSGQLLCKRFGKGVLHRALPQCLSESSCKNAGVNYTHLLSLGTGNRRCCCNKTPQQLDKILPFFLNPHIWEIAKLAYKKTLSGVCCMKPATKCMLIASISQAYCMTEFSRKQLCWFPGYSAGKNQISVSCWWRFVTATSAIGVSSHKFWRSVNLAQVSYRFCTFIKGTLE